LKSVYQYSHTKYIDMDRNDTDVNALKAQIDGDFTWYQIQKRDRKSVV